MTEHVETIDDRNFDSEVLTSSVPYLLDFSATWCAPCKALNPIIAQLAAEYRGQLRVGKIDLDDSPATAARLGVRGAPTLIVFEHGKELRRQLGLTSKNTLIKLLGLTQQTQPSLSR